MEGREFDSRPGHENFRCPGRAWFLLLPSEIVHWKCQCAAHWYIIKNYKFKKKIIAGFRWFQVVSCFSNYRLFILLSLLIYSIRIPFPFPDSMFQGVFENGAKIFSFPSCRRGLTNG